MNLTYDQERLEAALYQIEDLQQLVKDLRQDVKDRDALIAKYAHDLEAMTALAKRLKAAIDAL